MEELAEHLKERTSSFLKIPQDESHSIIRVLKTSCSYTWSIYNFSYSFDHKDRTPFSSPMFASGCNNELQWDINLYPIRTDKKNKDYVSLRIYYYENDDFDEVLADCKVSILDQNGDELYTVKTDGLYSFSTHDFLWEKDHFIKRDYLMDKKNGLLVDDKLTLLCKINAYSYYEKSNEDKDLSLQISQSKIKLTEDLKLLLEGKLYDAVFLVHEKKFLVHKSILASRSRVFAAMFEHQMTEQTNNTVVITDISSEAFNELIQYIYTGKIENIHEFSNQLLRELLIAADKYQLDDLKDICEVMFYHKLTFNNAIETLIFADFNNADKLKNQVTQFIVVHNKEFIDNPEFESLSKSHPHLLPNFIESNINCFDEDSCDLDFYRNYDNDLPMVDTPITGKNWGVSQIKVDKCHYSWKIDNFSFFLKQESTEESIFSQRFTKNDNKFSWQLVLCPKGVNAEMKDYISLFIQLGHSEAEEVEVRAQYEFFIINKDKKKVHNVKSDILIFFSLGEKLGEPMFLKKDFLLENAEDLLPNDTLTVGCEVSSSFRLCTRKAQLETMNFCVSKYQLGVSRDHEALFQDEKFSDITINCCEVIIKVHRALLSVRSPRFFDMLKEHAEKEDESVVKILDMDPVLLKKLLLFLYSGTVDDLDADAKDLYVEANKYEIADLRFICEAALCTSLTLKNACDYFVFAHVNKACKLKSQAANFITTHLTKVIKTPGYKSLADSRPQLLKDIIYKLNI